MANSEIEDSEIYEHQVAGLHSGNSSRELTTFLIETRRMWNRCGVL